MGLFTVTGILMTGKEWNEIRERLKSFFIKPAMLTYNRLSTPLFTAISISLLITIYQEKHKLWLRWWFLSTIPYFNDIIKAAIKDGEKLEPLCILGGNVEWCHCCETQYDGFSKN